MNIYSQPTHSTPSLETLLASEGIEKVELVLYKGDPFLLLTVPTGERLVDILDYTKFIIRDREDCYQDLELFVKMTKIGTEELRTIQDEGKEIKLLIQSADKNIDEATDLAEDAIKEPWLLGIWREMKRGVPWFGAGAAAATILIITSNN